MKYSVSTHLTAASLISVIILCMYVSVQQVHRSMANDPQLQQARDISQRLSTNRISPAMYSFLKDTTNLSSGLNLFTVLYDTKGKPLLSNGIFNNSMPQLPQGVFKYTLENGEDLITWQPQNNVRMAMVVERVNNNKVGFVAVGRSLKEVEIREHNLLHMVAATWAICMMILFMHFLIERYMKRREINYEFN